MVLASLAALSPVYDKTSSSKIDLFMQWLDLLLRKPKKPFDTEKKSVYPFCIE